MNRRQLGLGAAVTAIASGAGMAALAQTRDPGAVAFYDAFNDQLARLPAAIQPDVRAFYELNGWRPVWTPERLRALQTAAGRAERHGLSQSDFFDFDALAADRDAAEMRTTAAALVYARVLAEGRVRPETVEDLWEMQKNRVDLPFGSERRPGPEPPPRLVRRPGPDRHRLFQPVRRLCPLSPPDPRRRLAGLPSGPTIEPGASDARIPALIQRLVAEGDLAAADGARLNGMGNVYGPELEAAVRGFQTRHGLAADGRIGTGTQRSLSASAEDRARQIALNLERRRWLKREVAPERIEVNTAAAIMVYWKDGRPVHSNRVIVGTAANQTPSLEKPFASVVANPPWYVPASIARAEILPRGPAYLASQNMYISNGTVIQRAGPNAALGYVKFELRDSYAIFLHDTPWQGGLQPGLPPSLPRLRAGSERGRLRPPAAVARPRAAGQFDTPRTARETRRIQTGREISVRLLYWTAFVDGQGRVAFREDVYSRDARLAQALGIALSLPKSGRRRSPGGDRRRTLKFGTLPGFGTPPSVDPAGSGQD
jgi:murein L,D-transpeptidase YcbB/YkuD